MSRLPLINFAFLILIAALLSGRLYLDYGRPYLVLKNNTAFYSSSYITCEKALENESALSDGNLGLSAQTQVELMKSLTVEKLSCDEKNLLKETILAAGVKLEQINAIEIRSKLENY